MNTPTPANRIALVFALVVLNCLFIHRGAAQALAAGQKAPAFNASTIDGKVVRFPVATKGRVVLIDFWATWCGPCRAEIPNVVAAYQKYHAQGLEIVGISLDQANAGATVARFTQANRMAWPQIYDGKYWEAAIAVQYGIRSIPQAFLVDGDTGVILAAGDDVRGRDLAPAIEKALAAKKKK